MINLLELDLMNLMGVMSSSSNREAFSIAPKEVGGQIPYNFKYIDVICDIFQTDEVELKSPLRRREVVEARFMCFAYLRKSTSLTFDKMSKMFNKDHSLAVHAIKKHKGFIESNDPIYLGYYDEFRNRMNLENYNF